MAEHDGPGDPLRAPTNAAAILAMLADNSPRDEPYRERDCPACDVASEVVGALALEWDPNESWWAAPAVGWPGGLTMAQQVEKVVAHVLHRRMPGTLGRPKVIEPARKELVEILSRWRPGSGDWDWPAEWADLSCHHGQALAALIPDVAERGVITPVLLGDDGRVWDGHKRLMVAQLLGIASLPIEYGRGGLA